LLADKPLRDVLLAFASTDPTPGGGSAAALASAIGASLLMMVASLPRSRTGSDEDKAALEAAAGALAGVRQQLTDAIDADAAAYDQVIAAFRRPKSSPDEQAARKAAIERALTGATEVPLGVMRESLAALRVAEGVAAHGHRAAASDVGAAVALLGAGFEGARLNVRINLDQQANRAYADRVAAELEQLEHDARASVEAAGIPLARGKG
jgi:formiminotetrahydrofolate cyclodeaminase